MAAQTLKIAIATLCLCFATLSHAETTKPPAQNNTPHVNLEVGSSLKVFGATEDNKKLLLSAVHQNIKPWLFHEAAFGGWVGKYPSALIGYHLGVSKSDLSFQLGPNYISAKTPSLNSYWQILLGLRYTAGPLMLSFKHFSNGSKVFRHDKKPNDGLNFIALGVSV
jgi:hypothetical protein